MISAGALFVSSASLFLLVAFLTRQEEVKGRRFILVQLRDWLDGSLKKLHQLVSEKAHQIFRYTIKLSWYYSIHSFLRGSMRVLVALYDRLELVFIHNRDRAKVLRAEKRNALIPKNHLEIISEHKEATALTPAQKKKLRAKKLAGD